MFEFIANLLGIASNYPFRYPAIGLIMALVSAFISWMLPGVQYSWIFALYATITAFWIFTDSIGHPLIAPALSMLGVFFFIGAFMAQGTWKLAEDARAPLNQIINPQSP